MLAGAGLAILKAVLTALFSEGFKAINVYLDGMRREGLADDRGRLRSELRQKEEGERVQAEVDAVPTLEEDDALKRLKDNTA